MAQLTEHDLRCDLRDCQRRLGTDAEEPGDFELAHRLAHEINNLRAIACLHAALADQSIAIAKTRASA